jgi:hypothetical protein
MAIVDTGGISINDYHENTGDKLYVDGYYYSDKAPGLSFAGAPIYGVIRLVLSTPPVELALGKLSGGSALEGTLNPEGSGVNQQKVIFALVQYILTVTLICLPSAFLGVVLYSFMGWFTSEVGARLFLVFAYGLGTVAFPYSTVFYSHQLAAILTFLAFFLVFRIRWQQAPMWHLWLAGALLGFALISEYPTGVIAVVIGLYALLGTRNWKAAFPLGLAALPFILLWMFYNYARFGDPLELGYKYHATFTQHAQAGFAGLAGFRWDSFWDITFSNDKGLFFRSPFLLLVIPALVKMWRDRRYSLEALATAAILIGYLWYSASFYDWGGGHTAGPRYLVAMLPFMVFPLATLVEIPAWRWTIFGLASISIILVGMEAVAGQHFPYQELNNPWLEYTWPSWREGDIARNLGTIIGLSGWYSLLPLIAIIGGLAWILFKQLSRRLQTA